MAERFHIGEWYGRPFLALAPAERVAFATHRVGRAIMSRLEIQRLTALEERAALGTLPKREQGRLVALRTKLDHLQRHEMPCPFRRTKHAVCTKPGGVCSLQLLTDADGEISPVGGKKGKYRALCPYRFHQEDTVFKEIGQVLLDDAEPVLAGEVGFLESTGNLDSDAGEDVGRIDMILVSREEDPVRPMKWAAAEIQAVYFSGPEMNKEFEQIIRTGGALEMAQKVRRPDYRSSGPKRLMPQLQIKVPTLRRWGKKMAIVVDEPFFHSMGAMSRVDHISNADVVWFIVDFEARDGSPYAHLRVIDHFSTTLESAIEGLTGGIAVPMPEFENRIRSKLTSS